MTQFRKGDIVQVEFTSAKLLEQWLNGNYPVGPGDLGVVTYSTGDTGSQWVCNVTVEFPMIGLYGVHSANLKLVRRAEAGDADTEG